MPSETGPLLVLAAAIACAAGASGCSPSSAASPATAAAAAASTGPATTVDLTGSQLSVVRVAPAGLFRFPIEKTELGNVGFVEDPAFLPAESTLLGAAASLRLTRKELQRARRLYETQGISARELEQATSDEQTAAAALAAARVALHALGMSEARIDSLVATGRIDTPHAARGRAKWVEADAFESDLALFRPGQPVRVSVPAYPGQLFRGAVSRVYATVNPNLHRQTLRCEVADPRDELRPGMLATITIVTHEPLEALAVPENGLVREGDGTLTAWVTSDRRHYTQRVVKAGLRADGWVQILAGVTPGELVVTDGAIFLDNMINAVPSD
jgi:membrane fusion protein, heavy metal efflux system